MKIIEENGGWIYSPIRGSLNARRDESRCSFHVFTGQRGDVAGHQCFAKATTTRDGYPVCHRHSADAIAKREAAKAGRFAAEQAGREAGRQRSARRQHAEAVFPDMLAALQAALGHVRHSPTCDALVSSCQCGALAAIESVRAAIAKANLDKTEEEEETTDAH